MSESCTEAFRCRPEDLQQAMAVHTRKITDSCRDKDCIEDLRVYLTQESQTLLDTATGARVRCAELLFADLEVEPVAFDRNHYCVDVTFYYRILADATIGNARPAALYGLAVFSKRAVLCGENSRTHLYRSDAGLSTTEHPLQFVSDRPVAVAEVLDPMVLGSVVRDVCDCKETGTCQIPARVCEMFDDELVISGECRRLFVTLGQFSIIRLERDAQLVVPVLDYAIPTKECCDSSGGCAEDPCEMFSRIPFPTEQFSPRGCEQSGHGDSGPDGGCGCYQTT